MKHQIRTKNALLMAALILLAAFSIYPVNFAEPAAANRLKALVAQKLTEKLRTELADSTVEVKISNLKNGETSPTEMNLDGRALAIVRDDETRLPLEFNAKVNLLSGDVEDVAYKFVESAPMVAPTEEDHLTRELMTQIRNDYGTTNIVISIDGLEAARQAPHQTVYEGLGEVRIGDFEWSKIKFNVTIDSQNKRATKILYQVQK